MKNQATRSIFLKHSGVVASAATGGCLSNHPGKGFFEYIKFAALLVYIFTGISSAQPIIEVSNTEQLPARLHDGTTLRFSAGTYFLTQPLKNAEPIYSLTIEAKPGEQVVLSAGRLIRNWKPASLNGHPCWSADLPAVRVGIWNFKELWVNGNRATRSRYPATGYLSAVIPVDEKTPWNTGQTWFGYKPGDLPEDWATALPPGVEATVMNRWEDSHLPLVSMDAQSRRASSSRRSVFQLQDGDPYFLEGAAQWLTHPGDWYLDRSAGVLYYLPRPGEVMESAQAIAPTTDRILELNHATGVKIRGITFSHSEWNLPEQLRGLEPQVGGFGQAAVGVPAAIHLRNCHDCRFESCHFEHLGNYAIEMDRGCQKNVIESCHFSDLGCGAIKIGEPDQRPKLEDQTFGNIIADCTIVDGGHLFPGACGILVLQSYDNQIVHNEISDLYYSAISLGWTWGYGDSLSRGNRIEANLIHDIGKKTSGDGPILSDMGAVYTLGARAGTIITGNVFHDITARVYGGWGIYLDEGSSGLLIEKNLVYRTTHGGFHLNYGKDNIVQNNIFARGRDVQIARSQVDPGLMLTFKHNIVSWDSGVFTQTDHNQLVFDENLYHCTGTGKMSFGTDTFEQWKAAGLDLHSVLADPGFTDPVHGDFSLRDESIGRQIHFEPFSTVGVGPRTR